MSLSAVRSLFIACSLACAAPAHAGELASGETTDGITRIKLLPPGPDNPRNSEGDFIELKDGRVLFVYTHFTGGAGDHASAHLAGRFSSDEGRSWTAEDVVILPNEAKQNVMSVSLLRLHDGRIALFYLRKNSLSDCRP
ncbi:MAG: exo-alpha-sialidase, partial [Planctomycetaceae bacterium]